MTIDAFDNLIVSGSTKKSEAVSIKLVNTNNGEDVVLVLSRRNAKYLRYLLKEALKMSK